jgi:triacylglycerol esterase/lipase EstA (alpha/beta hydrolase family)
MWCLPSPVDRDFISLPAILMNRSINPVLVPMFHGGWAERSARNYVESYRTLSPPRRGTTMSKITNDKQYEKKLNDVNKEGRRPTEQASERQKQLEGEVADYGQKLHARETKRPVPSEKKSH